jgi:hypothetical protein
MVSCPPVMDTKKIFFAFAVCGAVAAALTVPAVRSHRHAAAAENGITYYIDASAGSDANTGTSENSPWKTFSKIRTRVFQPGDAILLKRGSVWGETLIVSSSGSAGNPVYYGAYGTGADPLIDGVIAGIQNCVFMSGKSHVTIDSIACRNPQGPGEGGIRIQEGTGITVQNSSVRNAANGGITLRNVRDSSVRNNTLEEVRSVWGEGIHAFATAERSDVRNLVISGNTIRGIQGSAILVQDTDAVHIFGNTISDAGGYGITVAPNYRSIGDTDIQGNKIYEVSRTNFSGNGWSASGISVGTVNSRTHTGVRIRNNDVYNVYTPAGVDGNCIIVDIGANGAEVYGNTVHDCEGAGIQIVKAADVTVRHNVVWRNGFGELGSDAGINVGGYPENRNIRVYHNTLYGNNRGIRIADGGAVDTIIKNNIVAFSSVYALDYTSSVRTVSDYNLVYPDGKSAWRNTAHANFAAFRSASGQDAHSLVDDPKFQNPQGAAFTLRAGSPAIDAGVQIGGIVSDILGRSIFGTAPDVGAYEADAVQEPSPIPQATPSPQPSPSPVVQPTPSQPPKEDVPRSGGGGSGGGGGGRNSTPVPVSLNTDAPTNASSSALPAGIPASVAELQKYIQELFLIVQELVMKLVQQKSLIVPPAQNTQAPGSAAEQPATTQTAQGFFARNLSLGSRGEDVRELQKFLNGAGYLLATSGENSPGNETGVFERRTAQALAEYQKNRGIRPASGFFGPITREHLNSIFFARN